MPGDDEPAEDSDETDAEPSFDDRLDDAEAAVAAAEDNGTDAIASAIEAVRAAIQAAATEADLDATEGLLETIAGIIEETTFPEPDDEDEEPPGEALEADLDAAQDALEEARGPYAADVTDAVETATATVEETRWTADGESDVVEAVNAYVTTVNETLTTDVPQATDIESVPTVLDEANTAVDTAELDPDDDAATITSLVEATDALATGLDDAEEWADLTTREQLQAEGFYDVLGHRKDFPPEWSALKEHEKRGNVDMVLLALEKLGMEFMEEHCLDALKRMGDEAALEPMLERAERRNRPAIEILGKIGSDEPVDTLLEYIETDADPQLQKTTLKALGEIGATTATEQVAAKLDAENEILRSYAARALGMIGDTRAIEPLTDVLENDSSATVRGSAAWALNQIGTQRALEAIAEHVDDRVYLVQTEAEKAAKAL